MLNLDDRPAVPPLPQFSRDMQHFLLTAARATATARVTPRRRLGRYAAAGLAAAAVATAVAVGVEYAASGGSHHPGAAPTGSPTQTGGVHIHLAAFSVETHPDGTVTLTLTQGQLFDPNAVRRALARAGVPAVVTVNSVCTVPGRPSNGLPQVISGTRSSDGQTVTTITPSAIPAGEKLSFGYFAVANGGGLHISLVPDNAPLTCTSTPPAAPHHGSGPTR